MRVVSLFVLFFLSIESFDSQNKKTLDSLLSNLSKTNNDTSNGKTFIRISGMYGKATKFDSALISIDQAISLFRKAKSGKWWTEALSYKAKLFYKLKSDYSSAFDVYKEYYRISDSLNYKEGMADACHGLGNMCLYQSDYKNSLSFYLQAIRINEETGNKRWLANDLTNMGIIYMRQKEYNLGKETFTKASEIYTLLNDSDGLSATYKNIGVCYSETKNYDQALVNYLKAAEIEKVQKGGDIAATYNDIGLVYLAQKNLSKALQYFNLSRSLLKNESNDYSLVYCLQGLGNVYHEMKNYSLSKSYLLQAADVAERAGMTYELMETYELLATSYETAHDFKNAYKYAGLRSSLKDSIHNEDNRNAIAEMQTKYETENKEKEISLLKKEQDISALSIEKQRVIIFSGVGGILLLLAFMLLFYNRYRTKQKLNEQLARLSIVARSTDNIVIIMDAHGKIEWANESFSRFNGITIEELIKQKGESIYDISNNEKIREIIETAVSEKRSMTYESLNKNKAGEKLWEQSTLTPIWGKDGELVNLIIVDTNITQRKLDEQIISEKNKDITDSINYAKKIQEAMLPAKEIKEKVFPNAFVLFKPRDIVSGDFYWYTEKNGRRIIAAVDCTGHGVPGALMSMIGTAFLNEIINQRGIIKPDLILSELRHLVIKTLKQSSAQGENKDGMDISIISIDDQKSTVEFAGANNPLWMYRKENDRWQLNEFLPDKRPIGYFQGKGLPFSRTNIKIEPGDRLYLFTDGFADQFGGEKGKKYKYSRLKETLSSVCSLTMPEQELALEKDFINWKGDLEQVDDVLIIGIAI